MLYDQQEMYYGSDMNFDASERVFYLNPMMICEERHKFRIEPYAAELEGLEGQERDKKIHDLQLDFESKYSFYIAITLLKYQDRKSIMAPYNFG